MLPELVQPEQPGDERLLLHLPDTPEQRLIQMVVRVHKARQRHEPAAVNGFHPGRGVKSSPDGGDARAVNKDVGVLQHLLPVVKGDDGADIFQKQMGHVISSDQPAAAARFPVSTLRSLLRPSRISPGVSCP